MSKSSKSQWCGRSGGPILNRRDMLRRTGMGFGSLALASLLRDDGLLSAAEPKPTPAPVAGGGKAKSVIFLYMGGGPSHVDTWDPKPELAKLHGKDIPESIVKSIPLLTRSRLRNLYASPFRFTPRGQSGIEVSELFPETGQWVDDICLLRSCQHDNPIHAPAEYILTTGTALGNRPSLGSWLNYGLGSINANLPGFFVLQEGSATSAVSWASGFLPARYQGTMVKVQGIPNLAMPPGTSAENRKAQLNLFSRLNDTHLERHGGDSDLEARIRSYELAFRMQTAATEAFDLSRETAATQKLYGLEDKQTAEFGKLCLLARRLVERGVRFLQVSTNGHDWDAHEDLLKNHRDHARKSDRPIAGLLADLKRRGLLDETLVFWGGEFGRTPTTEIYAIGAKPGRDHSPMGYSMWLAGGGVKGGQVIGATDPVGYVAIERPIHPNDLHATILHALGIDQHQLFYQHNNRKEIVTVDGGKVVQEVFA